MINQITFTDGPFDVFRGLSGEWFIRVLKDGKPDMLAGEILLIARGLNYLVTSRKDEHLVREVAGILNRMVERGELVKVNDRWVKRDDTDS